MTIHSSDSRAARAEALALDRATAYSVPTPATLASHADVDLVASPAKLATMPPPPVVSVEHITTTSEATSTGVNVGVKFAEPEPAFPDAGFLRDFLKSHKELEAYE